MEHQRDSALARDITPYIREDYEYLRYTNGETLKHAFRSGDVRDPSLMYGDIDPSYIEERLADIDGLGGIVDAYDDRLVQRAYRSKLRELREKYELLDAAARGDDAGVFDASVRLYGRPKEDLFRFAERNMRARIARIADITHKDPHMRNVLEILQSVAGFEDGATYAWDGIRLPEPKVFDASSVLRAEEIRRAFVQAFERYGIAGWTAVVDAPGERTTFNTNHDLRTVFIPSDDDIGVRKYPLTREQVEGIIAHEVGTHIVRRERGAASPLALLGLGLANYLRGEEGVATYAEQTHHGARHFAGILGYLAVGWAVGLDGTPRNFRALYDILKAYIAASSVEHALAYGGSYDSSAVCARAERQAWARCVRVFRGTTGNTPGACFTKDIVYLEGNIAIWQLIMDEPAWTERFGLGKYDPANPSHVALLRELGMLP